MCKNLTTQLYLLFYANVPVMDLYYSDLCTDLYLNNSIGHFSTCLAFREQTYIKSLPDLTVKNMGHSHIRGSSPPPLVLRTQR